MPKIDKKAFAAKVLEYLEEGFPGAPLPLNFSNAWELLVATQLSAQCTDARVNEVTPEFFRRWPTPQALLQSTQEEIEDVIRSTGFFHNKAKNLMGCAAMLVEKYGGEVPRSMEEMIKLPGVARKTANVVLYGAYGMNEGLAVDTHVKRIAHRLGFTKSQEPVKIEKDLMEIFPREAWGKVNHRMVLFGRAKCKARKPLCDTCALAGTCPKKEPPKIITGKTTHEPESSAESE